MEVTGDTVEVNGITIGLDAKKGSVNFISHAHSDHAKAFSKKIPAVSSEQTIAMRQFGGETFSSSSLGKLLDGASVNLLEAGHIFGAKQLFLENSSSVLFTGDIKLKPNLMVKSCDLVHAETLILDCTYGKRNYVFPDSFDVYSSMERYIRTSAAEINVLMGYSTGKAQELIKFVNEYMGETPVVEPSIARISEVIQGFGCKLDYQVIGSDEAKELMKGRYTAICTPSRDIRFNLKRAGKLLNKKTSVVYATGWAIERNLGYMADRAFPLSDHCDFNELVEFVQQVNPKKVICRYGFTEEFASHLRGLGYDAVAH